MRLPGNVPLALWTMLNPRPAVTVNPREPGEAQDCVVVEYVLFGAVLGPKSFGVATGIWALEVSDHALLQLLARDPQAEIAATLFGAHHALLSLPMAAIQLGQTAKILVPAGAGVFICDTHCRPDRSLGGRETISVRARTFLHNDQLHDDQTPFPPALPGERAGEGFLLPAPLCRLIRLGQVVTPMVPPWLAGFGMPKGGRA